MQSLSSIYEIFSKYPDSDKGSLHSYLEVYEKLFEPIREQVTSILEVGIRYGGSLKAFAEYFPNATIYGLDNGSEDGMYKSTDSRIKAICGDSTKLETLTPLFSENTKFDTIVEDGSHRLEDQIATYTNVSPLLKPKGLYILEDLESIENAIQFQKLFGGQIVDRRHIKERHDDILVVLTAANP